MDRQANQIFSQVPRCLSDVADATTENIESLAPQKQKNPAKLKPFLLSKQVFNVFQY
jgi:hypothetical protein